MTDGYRGEFYNGDDLVFSVDSHPDLAYDDVVTPMRIDAFRIIVQGVYAISWLRPDFETKITTFETAFTDGLYIWGVSEGGGQFNQAGFDDVDKAFGYQVNRIGGVIAALEFNPVVHKTYVQVPINGYFLERSFYEYEGPQVAPANPRAGNRRRVEA